MFGGRLGVSEMALIIGVALVIFGPKKLPELGKSIGESIREFKRSMTSISEDTDKTV